MIWNAALQGFILSFTWFPSPSTKPTENQGSQEKKVTAVGTSWAQSWLDGPEWCWGPRQRHLRPFGQFLFGGHTL